jgi:hypothetical protein
MAMCPLLKSDCVRGKCEWWYVWDNEEGTRVGACVMTRLPGMLDDHLVDIFNRINDLSENISSMSSKPE